MPTCLPLKYLVLCNLLPTVLNFVLPNLFRHDDVPLGIRSSSAVEDDAIAAGIPAGYSINNWDPTEAPVILLGSVFDASSLGTWIYDWTVYHHGASTPMADIAGDLWLLLIKLAAKRKRADECIHRIKSLDHLEIVEDFIESGSRLWQKFKLLLKDCGRYMWKARRERVTKGAGRGSLIASSVATGSPRTRKS